MGLPDWTPLLTSPTRLPRVTPLCNSHITTAGIVNTIGAKMWLTIGTTSTKSATWRYWQAPKTGAQLTCGCHFVFTSGVLGETRAALWFHTVSYSETPGVVKLHRQVPLTNSPGGLLCGTPLVHSPMTSMSPCHVFDKHYRGARRPQSILMDSPTGTKDCCTTPP